MSSSFILGVLTGAGIMVFLYIFVNLVINEIKRDIIEEINKEKKK